LGACQKPYSTPPIVTWPAGMPIGSVPSAQSSQTAISATIVSGAASAAPVIHTAGLRLCLPVAVVSV
jgi:hypothetical protein